MIIWLEDREDTIITHKKHILELNLECMIFPTPKSLKYFIEEEKETILDQNSVFVVDLMLHGITDLTDIGIENAPTLSGNHTGFVFADRFLRTEGAIWAQIPVCFLTERDPRGLAGDITALKERGPGEVDICRKYDDNELQRFKALIIEWMGAD